jgi:RNA polymerase sigma factor (sigma-70 family)
MGSGRVGVVATGRRRVTMGPAAAAASAAVRDVGFEVLYQDEYEPMVRVAALMLRDDDAAAEVVHDSFAKVYERWDRLDRPGAYLRTSVVNGCRDRRRRTRFRQQVVVPPAEAATLGQDDLLGVLDALSPRQRDALVLRFYLGLSEAEIAEALGVRPGTVKSLVHRGLAELAALVTDEPGRSNDGEGR